MNRTNTTSHYVFTFAGGSKIHDKCRDTLGGFANMIRRIEKEFGNPVRILSAHQGVICGDSFQIERVEA